MNHSGSRKIKVRKSGKYYQAGYYDKGRWVVLEHLGTAERIIELVRVGKQKQ